MGCDSSPSQGPGDWGAYCRVRETAASRWYSILRAPECPPGWVRLPGAHGASNSTAWGVLAYPVTCAFFSFGLWAPDCPWCCGRDAGGPDPPTTDQQLREGGRGSGMQMGHAGQAGTKPPRARTPSAPPRPVVPIVVFRTNLRACHFHPAIFIAWSRVSRADPADPKGRGSRLYSRS